jgi:CRISPR system Cascade subunit CasD
MANTLFLRLEGPLQSWGERGRWSVRDSASEPTKSGVIGLIACALGYREDEQIRPLSEKMRMGVRIDAPGRLITDYHTVGGGYEIPQLLQADRKPKGRPGSAHTELSYRDYLCDASFLVALQIRQAGDEALISQISEALQNPVWPVFLGRKSCAPTAPVFAGAGDFEDLQTALTQHTGFTRYRAPYRTPEGPITLRMVLETDDKTGVRHRDNLHSRRFRVFHPRYTKTPDNPPTFLIHEEDDHVSLQIATEQS